MRYLFILLFVRVLVVAISPTSRFLTFEAAKFASDVWYVSLLNAPS